MVWCEKHEVERRDRCLKARTSSQTHDGLVWGPVENKKFNLLPARPKDVASFEIHCESHSRRLLNILPLTFFFSRVYSSLFPLPPASATWRCVPWHVKKCPIGLWKETTAIPASKGEQGWGGIIATVIAGRWDIFNPIVDLARQGFSFLLIKKSLFSGYTNSSQLSSFTSLSFGLGPEIKHCPAVLPRGRVPPVIPVFSCSVPASGGFFLGGEEIV